MDEKDQIIASLRQQIQMLLHRIEQLEEEVARLKKDSHNWSKPSSSDLVKPPRIARKLGRKRNRGGIVRWAIERRTGSMALRNRKKWIH